MTSVGSVLLEFFSVLERLEITYLVGGSFASGVWGQPRQTNDIDLALRIAKGQVRTLVQSLEASFVISEDEILRTLEEEHEYRSFKLLHIETVFNIEALLKLASEQATAE